MEKDLITSFTSYALVSLESRGRSFALRIQNTIDFLSDSKSHLISNAYMGGADSSDKADFTAVDEAFGIVGVEKDVVNEIYKVVSAVLHLGNIRFVEQDDSHTATGTSISGVEPGCARSLNAVCSLLSF